MNWKARILMGLFTVVIFSPMAAHAYGPHGHYRGGIHGYYRGGIQISPWWFAPYPYYYYTAPPVVIEQPAEDYYVQPEPQQSEEPAYWYYCRKPEGYYPYVKQCPDGWIKVLPTPPANQ